MRSANHLTLVFAYGTRAMNTLDERHRQRGEPWTEGQQLRAGDMNRETGVMERELWTGGTGAVDIHGKGAQELRKARTSYGKGGWHLWTEGMGAVDRQDGRHLVCL